MKPAIKDNKIIISGGNLQSENIKNDQPKLITGSNVKPAIKSNKVTIFENDKHLIPKNNKDNLNNLKPIRKRKGRTIKIDLGSNDKKSLSKKKKLVDQKIKNLKNSEIKNILIKNKLIKKNSKAPKELLKNMLTDSINLNL